MIRYSHARLMISCKARDDAQVIDEALETDSGEVLEFKSQESTEEGGWIDRISYTWILDSPLGHGDGDAESRLTALADMIEPFSERLSQLRPRFDPWIDVVYHITPQHPHGVTGEFDWLRIPASVMRRFGAWDLSLSYETFWFDHPDWSLRSQSWWSRIRSMFVGTAKPVEPGVVGSPD